MTTIVFHRLQGKHVNRWITAGIVATWEVRGRYGGGMSLLSGSAVVTMDSGYYHPSTYLEGSQAPHVGQLAVDNCS